MAEGGSLAIATILASLDDIFDFFFGSGHAGSCGAFREAYFASIADVAPDIPPFFAKAQEAANNPDKSIFAPILDLSLLSQAVLAEADQGFEKFRGRNLLGQTMFFSRLHGWLERFVIFPSVQMLAAAVQQDRQRIYPALLLLSQQVARLRSEIDAQTPQIKEIRRRLDLVEIALADLAEQLVVEVTSLRQGLSEQDRKLRQAIEAGNIAARSEILTTSALLVRQIVQMGLQFTGILATVQTGPLKDQLGQLQGLLDDIAGTEQELRDAIEQGDLPRQEELHSALQDLIDRVLQQLDEIGTQMESLKILPLQQIEELRRQQASLRSDIQSQIDRLQSGLQGEAQAREQGINQLRQQLQQHIRQMQQELPQLEQRACECGAAVAGQGMATLFTPANVALMLCQLPEPPGALITLIKKCLGQEAFDAGKPEEPARFALVRPAMEDGVPAAIPG